MQTNKTKSKIDPIKKDHKTAPRGMAPDDAHYSGETSPGRRDVEPEGTFSNAPQNAQSKQTERLR